jgi:hypothetical protein
MNDEFGGSIGERMSEGNDQALKTLAILAGAAVYLGMIVYSAVHNWRLLTTGIAPEMVIWASLGVVALELTALALPVALHWWTHAALQRMVAFGFYALDLGLIFFNVVLDYAMNTGGTLPGWMQGYLFFIVPATPVVAGLGWSLLFLLDPSQKERSMIESLRAATRETLAGKVAEAARSADLTHQVAEAASIMAGDIIQQTLGASVRNTKGGAAAAVDRAEQVEEIPENGKVKIPDVPFTDLGIVQK